MKSKRLYKKIGVKVKDVHEDQLKPIRIYYISGAALGFEIDGAKSNLVSKIGVISGS